METNCYLETSDRDTICALMHKLYDYDPYTFEHCIHTALYTNVIVDFMNVANKHETNKIVIAALLHDIGKLEIPIEIIHKPDKLTVEEKKLMDTHSIHGYEIVKSIGLSEYISYAIRDHHENTNGSGYPNGYTAEVLNMGAKIIHVSDVYDAMLRARPYKKAIPHAEVIDYIEKNATIMFDPNIVCILNNVIEKYRARLIKPTNELLIYLINEFMSA